MGVYRTVWDLMARQKRRFHETDGDLEAKWRALMNMSLSDAKQLTSGTIGRKQARLLEWPWARIGIGRVRTSGSMRGARAAGRTAVMRMLGSVGVPKLPINSLGSGNTGNLHNSFKVTGNLQIGADVGKIQSAIVPDPAIAGKSINVLHRFGTFSSGRSPGGMIARGFWQEMERRFKARTRAFLTEMKKSLRKP